MPVSSEFLVILSNFDPGVNDLALAVRSLIFDVFPETMEVPWVKQKIAGYGTGPKKMSEHFCWIQPNKTYVNLGFNYGAELPDPNKLLEGTGKLFRHVKINSMEDINQPALRVLLETACRHRVPPPKKSG